MERIKEIWNQLESEQTPVLGYLKIRYSINSNCDVFLGIKYPENYRMFIVRTPFLIGKEFNLKYEFRGLKFEKIYDPDDSNFLLLNLVLVDKQFVEIFDSLVLDVLKNIINESEIKLILKNYSNRLVKWQSLFERFNQQGLTPEEQRGLFGELLFLRKFLQNNADYNSVINSWVGCEKQIRDFQFSNWSVEVKTTSGNNHQKVNISSERQLDVSNLENLFLFHVSLDVRRQSGETLNQIVDSISEIVNSDFTILSSFKNKLLEGGYFEKHRDIYESTGYFIRQEFYYKVEKDFPRIEERDIRNGVGDVKYSIIMSHCSSFIIKDQEVFKTIIFS